MYAQVSYKLIIFRLPARLSARTLFNVAVKKWPKSLFTFVRLPGSLTVLLLTYRESALQVHEMMIPPRLHFSVHPCPSFSSQLDDDDKSNKQANKKVAILSIDVPLKDGHSLPESESQVHANKD